MATKNLGRVTGLNAYEVWLQQGNTGTEEDFFNSLKGEPGTTDYEESENKPRINGVELTGNKTLAELSIPTYEKLSEYVMLQYSERIGHFVSSSGVNYEIDTDNKTITINEGFFFYVTGRMSINKKTLNICQDSVFSYLVYDLKATSESEKILSIAQTSFDTTRHVIMCILRRDYYTIPSANWIQGRYKVNGFLYNPETELKGTVYVSTTGVDKNNYMGDRNHPFLTINKALESGAKTIYILAGTYKETISNSNVGGEIEILAKPLSNTNKDVVIDFGNELSMVADSTTGLVKAAYASTSEDFIYKVFVGQTEDLVCSDSFNLAGYNCNLWKGDVKLTPVLTLEECQNTSGTWFYDGTNVYANADAGTFVLNDGSNQYGINLSYYKKVKLMGITVKHAKDSGALLKGCTDSEISRCMFAYSGLYNGLALENTSGVVRNCEAKYNRTDGLNIHGVGTADFIDCVSHDNGDDGISHHDVSNGMVIGGEYYNNGKGGVCSPTFGSRNSINGVYIHNNKSGVYAVTTTDGDYPPCTVSNCAIVGNETGIKASRYTLNCWNNIIKDNDTDTLCEHNGVINIIS